MLSEIRSDAQSTAQADSRVTIRAVLCWSEYYNGKWQPAKTSDVNRPFRVGEFDATGSNAFDRAKLPVSAHDAGDALRISLHAGGNRTSFYLFNTHSLPASQGDAGIFDPEIIGPSRHISVSNNDLNITYSDGLLFLNPSGGAFGKPRDRKILENRSADRYVEPNHDLTDPWDAPFFYEDAQHVFYVTATENLVDVLRFDDIVIEPEGIGLDPRIPPFLVEELPQPQPKPKIGPDDLKFTPDFGVVNPDPLRRFITEDANIHRAIGTTGDVKFGDVLIGPQGAIKRTGR